ADTLRAKRVRVLRFNSARVPRDARPARSGAEPDLDRTEWKNRARPFHVVSEKPNPERSKPGRETSGHSFVAHHRRDQARDRRSLDRWDPRPKTDRDRGLQPFRC